MTTPAGTPPVSLAAVAGLPMAAVPTVYEPMPAPRPRDAQAWDKFLDEQDGQRFYRARVAGVDIKHERKRLH